MTVRLYSSTDASAPSLTGQVGSLISLLDAVLVNGYGSKTAAGWTKAYSGTNTAAYQQNTTGANNPSGVFLYVNDNGPGAGAAREARFCGFETMSAITPTGTGQFPSSGQTSITGGYLCIRKSNTADATARPWRVIADGQTVHLFIENGDCTSALGASGIAPSGYYFGDFTSFKSGDTAAQAIIGRVTENQSNGYFYEPYSIVPGSTSVYSLNDVVMGHFCARSFTGVGGSIPNGKSIDVRPWGYNSGAAGQWSSGQTSTSSANMGLGRCSANANFPYPNPTDGALWLCPVLINHSGVYRGYYSGLWNPMHDRPLGLNDTYTVSGGSLNGKSLISQNVIMNAGNGYGQAQVHIEYSDTWN